MKQLTKAILAVLCAAGLALAVIAPAGAASTSSSWLHVNNPGTYCGFAAETVNASNPAPGSAMIFAEGLAEIKVNNPCVYTYGSGQSFPANYLKVQATLHCRWGGTGDSTVWTSATVGNAAGTGFVHVIDKGYDGSGTLNRCQDPDHLGLQERLVVTTQFYIIPAGYLTFTDTGAWVNFS